jgi:hypothetical protein
MNVLTIFSKCAKHPPAWHCELVLQTGVALHCELAAGDELAVRPLAGAPEQI